MIRINLLPQAKRVAQAKTSASLQTWFVLYGIVGVLAVLGLVSVYIMTANTLEEKKLKNAALAQRIEELKQKAGNLDELKAKLEQSLQLEKVVQQLQAGRLGPAKVLTELIHILSVNGHPTLDAQKFEEMKRDNPLAGYNPNWDVRRLWLTAFQEENRECKMTGFGKTNEDVAEFLRRLALSELFEEVTLQKTEATLDQETKLSMIGFELSCKVKY